MTRSSTLEETEDRERPYFLVLRLVFFGAFLAAAFVFVLLFFAIAALLATV